MPASARYTVTQMNSYTICKFVIRHALFKFLMMTSLCMLPMQDLRVLSRRFDQKTLDTLLVKVSGDTNKPRMVYTCSMHWGGWRSSMHISVTTQPTYSLHSSLPMKPVCVKISELILVKETSWFTWCGNNLVRTHAGWTSRPFFPTHGEQSRDYSPVQVFGNPVYVRVSSWDGFVGNWRLKNAGDGMRTSERCGEDMNDSMRFVTTDVARMNHESSCRMREIDALEYILNRELSILLVEISTVPSSFELMCFIQPSHLYWTMWSADKFDALIQKVWSCIKDR